MSLSGTSCSGIVVMVFYASTLHRLLGLCMRILALLYYLHPHTRDATRNECVGTSKSLFACKNTINNRLHSIVRMKLHASTKDKGQTLKHLSTIDICLLHVKRQHVEQLCSFILK